MKKLIWTLFATLIFPNAEAAPRYKDLTVDNLTATTAGLTDTTNKRFVTDANLVVIGNTSGVNTGNQTITLSGAVSGSGTGAITTALSSFSSSNLLTALTDETGSNKAVFSDAPTLVTPVLGVASATSINKVALTAPATGSTLTIADGKTLTASNTLTLAGTDGKGIDIGGATTGKILTGDGSNYVQSSYTVAAPGSSGNILTSDGTNWLSSAPSGGGASTMTTPGVTDPKLFSVAFGTTNTNTICSSSPCFIRAIGTGVTSVTRGSLGTYTVNFSATFALVNCSVSLADGSGSMSLYSGTNISCASCSSVTFDWANTSVLKDAKGVVMCHYTL